MPRGSPSFTLQEPLGGQMNDQGKSMDQRIAGLSRDNMSGATDLTLVAIAILEDFAVVAMEWPATKRHDELTGVARRLVQAQPAMAPILNLCSRVLYAGESAEETGTAWRDTVLWALSQFGDQLSRSNDRIAEEAWPLFADYAGAGRVLVHSASSAVIAALLAAHARGARLAVTCTESRPQLEGRQMAEYLAAKGLDVTLIVDAGMTLAATGCDLCLVGADAVGMGGVVNKLGTRGLALAARAVGIPLFTLCSMLKFWPAAAGGGPALGDADEHDPGEVYDGEATVKVSNRYFESCPLELFAGIVTDEGVLSPTEVAGMLDQIPYHAALMTRS